MSAHQPPGEPAPTSPLEPVPMEPVPPPERRGRAGRNLPAAIGVALLLGVVILLSLYVWKTAFVCVVVIAVVLGLGELSNALAALADQHPPRAGPARRGRDGGGGVLPAGPSPCSWRWPSRCSPSWSGGCWSHPRVRSRT